MLDILEKFVIRKGYCFSRLDGSTPTSLRQSLVDDFNSSPSKQVFLISTRAGGLGLNLVSANRVVIFDPNWNPAQDLQAQDRSFRFGQRRHVTVFRLLSAGSLEELVYTRQVYKQQLSNIAVSGKMEKRYFEGVQDSKEFQGELFGICNLFRDLSNKLFTSDIVGLQEKQGDENNQVRPSSKLNLGIFSDSSEKETASTHSLEGNMPNEVNTTLEDLGVVYAHRNEDIVNLGSRLFGKEIPNACLKEDEKQPNPPAKETKESDAVEVEVEVREESKVPDSSKKRKVEHSSLLALFIGMEEDKLNKILHSETST